MRKITITLFTAVLLTLPLSAQVKFKVLHNFGSGNDGNVPAGPLLLDSHDNLYGVTGGGPGQYGNGVLFELLPQKNGAWNENILYSFAGGNGGSNPWGGLVFGASDNLYGTLAGSTADVGAVFSLKRSTAGWMFDILYTDGIARADGPGIVLDKAGNLYGDIGPGQDFAGAIGEVTLETNGWIYNELYNFCSQNGCPDGVGEPAAPVWDTKGNLWGVTIQGGITQSPCFTSQGCGVIFEMTPNGDGTWNYNVMHEFASSSTDGQWPYGSLVRDGSGNFYGSTWLGGAYNHGTIFKFSNVGGTWQEKILYDFHNCAEGCMVEGTLARDKAGNLYGTAAGGTNSCAGYACGVVFKLAPQTSGSWKYSMLADFSEMTGGLQPFYGVIVDGSGNLYGVTSSFGKYGAGTAFEITP